MQNRSNWRLTRGEHLTKLSQNLTEPQKLFVMSSYWQDTTSYIAACMMSKTKVSRCLENCQRWQRKRAYKRKYVKNFFIKYIAVSFSS